MVRHTEADDGIEFDEDTRTALRNADVVRGEVVRVTVDPEADFDTIVGEVGAVYTDEKWAIQVEGESPDGKAYIVNADDGTVRVGNHRDGFEEVDARPVYVELPADEADVECVSCGSDNVKEGAAANPDETFDFGCRDCGAVWDEDEVDVLVFDNTVHGAHEKTGKKTSTTTTKHVEGHRHGNGFDPFEYDGMFKVEDGGTVMYDPSPQYPEEDTAYEAGTDGRFE